MAMSPQRTMKPLRVAMLLPVMPLLVKTACIR